VLSFPFIHILYFPTVSVGLLDYQDTTLVEGLKIMNDVDPDVPVGS
jgi:hypothetical protein